MSGLSNLRPGQILHVPLDSTHVRGVSFVDMKDASFHLSK